MKTKKIIFIVSVLVLTMLSITCQDALAGSHPMVSSLEAPQNVTVEVEAYEDGTPLFNVKWTNPQSIKDLFTAADAVGEAPLSYQIDVKAGNSKWTYDIIGDTINGNGLHMDEDGIILNYTPCNPIHLLENLEEIDAADIESNVFYFRVRYSYLNPHEEYDEYIYSPFSNVSSVGDTGATIEDFYGYSDWAYGELKKAEEYGLITDSVRAEMNSPITREEFAELAVRLVETLTGEELPAASEGTFTDTKNKEVLKAYAYGIVSGVGDGRFDPNALTNREQIATMTARALQPDETDLAAASSGVEMFSDENQVSDYALPYVRIMAQHEIVKGSEGKFHPKDTCTREQAVLIVKRVYEAMILSLLNELGDLPEKGGAGQTATPPIASGSQSIAGGWSSEGPHGQVFDAYDNLIDTYYNGTFYIFNSDGTFRYVKGGSGPFISGIIFWSGTYACLDNQIVLSQIKESWFPAADNKSGTEKYTDKAVSDTTLTNKFIDSDKMSITDDFSSMETTFYRISE